MNTRREFLGQSAWLGGVPVLAMLGVVDESCAQSAVEAPGEYRLPPLPYRAESLEPHIDGRTMRIHHAKYHAACMVGLNDTLKKLQQARAANDFSTAGALSQALAYYAGGFVNHTIFWHNMAPPNLGGGGRPEGPLAERIDAEFGSFEQFKAQFSAAAAAVPGSGWAVLGYHPLLKRLLVSQIIEHQNFSVPGLVPLLLIDVWEHAYILQYGHRREDYVAAWWKVVSWADVAGRVKRAEGRG